MKGARGWVILIILGIAVLHLGATRKLGTLWQLAFSGKAATK